MQRLLSNHLKTEDKECASSIPRVSTSTTKNSSWKFQGVFRRWSGRRFLFFRFETSKQKKGLQKKLLKLGDLKIHGIFRFLPEPNREIPWLFPGSPKNSGLKTKQRCCFLYCQSWRVLCHQKQGIYGDWTYLARWGLWLGRFFRSFPWRGRDLVTSTLHSRLRGRLWKEFGRMVLGWYQDHPVQLFSYVAKLQTQFQRIDEPNAQKNS